MFKLFGFNNLNGKYLYGMSLKQLFLHFNNTLQKGRALRYM